MMQALAQKDARIKELEALLGNLELKPKAPAVDHAVAEAAYKEAVSTIGRSGKTYNGYGNKGTLDGAMLTYAIEFVKAHNAGCSLPMCPKEVARFADAVSQDTRAVKFAMKAYPEYSFPHPLKKDTFVHAPSYGMWKAIAKVIDFEWGDAEGFSPQTKYGTAAFNKASKTA
jgi:hypothetical protein